MALKDLVGNRSALAEEAIERIVTGLVIFEIEERAIALTREGAQLSNRAKTLVYLTALQGWPFIVDVEFPLDARPIEIEQATGVTGNSLRPILKKLVEERLVVARNGRYAIRATNLQDVETELRSA